MRARDVHVRGPHGEGNVSRLLFVVTYTLSRIKYLRSRVGANARRDFRVITVVIYDGVSREYFCRPSRYGVVTAPSCRRPQTPARCSAFAYVTPDPGPKTRTERDDPRGTREKRTRKTCVEANGPVAESPHGAAVGKRDRGPTAVRVRATLRGRLAREISILCRALGPRCVGEC